MNDLSLLLTSIFVIIALFLSKSFKAGVEKDMIVATVRAVIQLLIIGYVLSLIFRGDHPIFIILMVLLMLTAASHNVAKRKKNADRLILARFSDTGNRGNRDAGTFTDPSHHSVHFKICHSDKRHGHRKLHGALKSVFKPAQFGSRPAERRNPADSLSRRNA